MKTKEQIEAMAKEYALKNEERSELIERRYWSFVTGYEQAQKDFQEREAKLVSLLKDLTSLQFSNGYAERAREVLKELGYE